MKIATPRSLVFLGLFLWLLAAGCGWLAYVHNDGAIVDMTRRTAMTGQAPDGNLLVQALLHLREITWALGGAGVLSLLAALAGRSAK